MPETKKEDFLEFEGKFEAAFPAGTTHTQVKAAIRSALDSLGAEGIELYVGDDQPPPQSPPPTKK